MDETLRVQRSRLLQVDLDARRALARPEASAVDAPFAVLAESLLQDLQPLIDAPLPIPEHKARLTRFGGMSRARHLSRLRSLEAERPLVRPVRTIIPGARA